MDNDNGAINFAIGLDNTQLAADAAKARAQLAGIGNAATAEGSRMQNAFSTASGYITMAAMAGVASIGILGKTILDTTAKFEKFGIVLKNTLGDVKGGEALSMIANFAATTPFQLDEVTGAFIKMANQGFVPTQAEMVKLGDLASSTGKSFDQLGEALLDAQTGQFERLKDFGIKASANGDKVTFSFKEQQTTVENTNSSIQKYILSLGELKGVAGANALISASLTGQISNLSDKLAAMYNEIGTGNKGLLYSVVGGASTLIENYKAIGDVITGLIGIYGVYKVAVMVIAYQDGLAIAAKARNLAIETAMEAELAAVRSVSASSAAAMALNAVAMSELRAAATVKVIAAEEALAATQKASSLANPYVLAAMAVAALGYAIYKVVTYQTDLEKSTQKLNVEIANEKDKAAQLFAELGNAAKETDEWKKAKEAILSQYGTYLTEQQKELSNTKLIGEAYAIVNGEIEKTIGLRVRNEALAAVSAEFNPKIKEAQQDLTGLTKGSLSREAAAKYNGRASVLVELIKYTTDPEAKAKAVAEYHKINEELIKATINDGTVAFAISKQLGIINKGLTDYKQGMDDVNKAFKEPAESTATPPPPPNPILTTYQAQRKELQKEKAKLEKELTELMAKPGEDPTKAVNAKQVEIDKINKQLGITAAEAKKASKESVDREKEVVEAMKTATGEKLTLLAKELVALQKVQAVREKMISDAMFDAKYGGANLGDAGMNGVEMIGKKSKAVSGEKKNDTQDVISGAQRSIEVNIKRGKDLIDQENDKLKKQADGFYAVADAAGTLANSIGDSNRGLADMLGGIANAAGQIGDLAKKGLFSAEGMSKGDAINAGLGAASSMMSMIISQGIENKRVQDSWTQAIAESVHQASLLKIESLAYKEANIFGVENPYSRAIAGANQYRASMNELSATSKQLEGGAVQVGTKKVASGSNIAAGVVSGAIIGTVIPGIGNLIGGVIGGVVGGFVGLLTKKTIPVFDSLKHKYGEIYDKDTFELNPKIVADYAKLDDSTKKIVDNWDEIKAKAKAAQEEMQANFKSLAGNLGTDLSDSLIQAFRNGKLDSAIVDFHKKVGDVVADILQQMIFAQAFQATFDKLGADMNASFGLNADGSAMKNADGTSMTPEQLAKLTKANGNKLVDGTIDDDIEAFGNGLDGSFKLYEELATKTDTELRKRGFENGLGGSKGADARNATSKGFTTMSQDSANELNGRFTAMQGHTFSINEGMKILQANSGAILKSVQGIETNTGRLESMQTDMKLLREGMGSVKQGIDDINLRGITLRK